MSFLHDPLAVLSLIDERPLHFETLRIATAIEGGILRTREVGVGSESGRAMRVATAVDAAAARDAIVARLLG